MSSKILAIVNAKKSWFRGLGQCDRNLKTRAAQFWWLTNFEEDSCMRTCISPGMGGCWGLNLSTFLTPYPAIFHYSLPYFALLTPWNHLYCSSSYLEVRVTLRSIFTSLWLSSDRWLMNLYSLTQIDWYFARVPKYEDGDLNAFDRSLMTQHLASSALGSNSGPNSILYSAPHSGIGTSQTDGHLEVASLVRGLVI